MIDSHRSSIYVHSDSYTSPHCASSSVLQSVVVKLCVYCWQVLSESGNSMEMNVLTKSIEEIEAKIQPQNKKYVSDNHVNLLLISQPHIL